MIAFVLLLYPEINANQFRATSSHLLSGHLCLYLPPEKHEVMDKRGHCLFKAGKVKLVLPNPAPQGPDIKVRKHR